MQRSPDHVLQFVLAELGSEGSIGGDGHLTVKGKFGPKHIESLLRKYISKKLHQLSLHYTTRPYSLKTYSWELGLCWDTLP